MGSILKAENVCFQDLICYPPIGIKRGQATFICGESGCGKSTLLKLFSGVVSPSSGGITFDGRDLESYDPIELRKEVLLCAQGVYLFHQTIAENFNTFYDYRGLPRLRAERMQEYLRVCRIDFPLDTPCATMSGGERQRVFVAACLSLASKVLMLDEPTAALDDQTAQDLIHSLKEYCRAKGITLLVVCHNRLLAERYADELIILERRNKA